MVGLAATFAVARLDKHQTKRAAHSRPPVLFQ
jgi:hypothetical protein